MPDKPIEPFEIAGHIVDPGTERDVRIPITTMATGVYSMLAVRVLHGVRPGPTVFVSAAIHGDEIIGTAVIQRLARELSGKNIAGTIMLVPVCNIFGFLNHSRYLPDRRDLNRSFPGNEGGSLAGQLAHIFFTEVVSRASLGIDIHTAAVHRYNLPQVRIAAGNKRLVELATVFGAPVVIEAPLREGSLRALASEVGVDMLLLEAGEALRFDDLSVETGFAGVLRVLDHLGMVADENRLGEIGVPARSNKTQWVRATRGGVAHWAKTSGDPVHEGELLAMITGLMGEEPLPMFSPVDGIIIGHATLPVVNQGEALFHIASVAHPEKVGARIESITDAILETEPEGFAEALLDEDEVL